MRQFGLGHAVDRASRRITPALEDQIIEFDGTSIHCTQMGHVAYMRDLVEHGHDVYFRELFRKAIRPGSSVVDGGAHLGVMSLTAASAAEPGGSVFAFEPNPETRPVLHENIARNGATQTVSILPYALSSEASRATFYLANGGNTSSLHDDGSQDLRPVVVEAVRADDVLPDDLVVDAIKLDVEGHEIGALQGMRELIARSHERVSLFVECNPDALHAAGHSADELIECLRGFDLEVRWIDDAARCVHEIGPGMQEHHYVNLICARPGRLDSDIVGT